MAALDRCVNGVCSDDYLTFSAAVSFGAALASMPVVREESSVANHMTFGFILGLVTGRSLVFMMKFPHETEHSALKGCVSTVFTRLSGWVFYKLCRNA